MAKKKEQKTDEQLRQEFLEREAEEYAKRVKPAVIVAENTTEAAETAETNTEETAETEGA